MFAEIWVVTTEGTPCVSMAVSTRSLDPRVAYIYGVQFTILWATARGLNVEQVRHILLSLRIHAHTALHGIGVVLIGDDISVSTLWADGQSYSSKAQPTQWASA